MGRAVRSFCVFLRPGSFQPCTLGACVPTQDKRLKAVNTYRKTDLSTLTHFSQYCKRETKSKREIMPVYKTHNRQKYEYTFG